MEGPLSEHPRAFYPNEDAMDGQMAVAAVVLIVLLIMGLAGALSLFGSGLPPLVPGLASKPLAAVFAFFGLLSIACLAVLFRQGEMLRRNPTPTLEIKDEGLVLHGRNLPWRAIGTVRVVVEEPRNGEAPPRVLLAIQVLRWDSEDLSRPINQLRAVLLDGTPAQTLDQRWLATPVAAVAAAINAHRPEAAP